MPTTDSRTSPRPDEDYGSLARAAALRTVGRLQSGYQRDVPAAVAAVARLRREAGRDPYASPSSWGLDDLADLSELREEKQREQDEQQEGREDARDVSAAARRRSEEREEREAQAVHLAVTLWALHQQSLRDEGMHRRGWPLGRAVRRLAHGKSGTAGRPSAHAPDGTDGDANGPQAVSARRQSDPVEEASESVRKRFVRLGTSSDYEILSERLRQFVLLLRAARIPLDYGLLAQQLFLWQDEFRREDIRRAWGREFHLVYARETADGQQGETADTTPEDSAGDWNLFHDDGAD